MSFPATLIDKLLVHATGQTGYNAITSGYKSADKVDRDEYPWIQGFDVAEESEAAAHGQRSALYEVNFLLVRAENESDQMWDSIDQMRTNIENDFTLTNSVERAWISASEVSESGDRNKTVGVVQVTALYIP